MFLNNTSTIFLCRIEYSDFNVQSIGGKKEIRPEKPALNNFKAYGWQK